MKKITFTISNQLTEGESISLEELKRRLEFRAAQQQDSWHRRATS